MKLTPANFSLYPKIYQIYQRRTPIKFPIVQGVLSQLQKGDVFVDEENNNFFVLHKFGFCQFFQEKEEKSQLIDFRDVISDPYFCQGRKLRWYAPHPLHVDFFQNVRSERTQMRLTKMQKMGSENINKEHRFSYEIKDIDFGMKIGERFWNSEKDLMDRGMGVAAFEEGKHIGTCYSASLVDGVAEIDIFVEEYCRKKGVGKALAQAFIHRCDAKNIMPNWDCFTNNIPSLSLAKSMGFSSVSTYPFLTIAK
jgi:RimJ/RimL family protein N-acetyltransferase